MNTQYSRMVEMVLGEIQDEALKEKVEKLAVEPTSSTTITFYPPSRFGGLTNASIPLTRRERRKLERKKKKL